MASMAKKCIALLLAACMAAALFGCNRAEPMQEDAAAFEISGLAESAIAFSEKQLREEFNLTEREATSVNSKGDERKVRAKGVLLAEILKRQNAAQTDFDSAVASAADGYSILIPASVLHERELLITFEIDGEPLENLRLVVPGERSMYWVKNLVGIEFTSAETKPVEKEVSLNTLIEQLQAQAEVYKHDGADCKALPIAVILEEIGAEQTEFVEIKAADGLVKTERYSTFAAQLLVFEGTADAPLFIGPDLPEGMQVKHISSIQIGNLLLKAN